MSKAKDTPDVLNLKSTLVPNTLPGTEGTYRHSVASIGLCDFDTFAERVGKKSGYGTPIVKNVLGAVGAEAAEILSTRLYRINAFGFSIGAEISGSVPFLDSPLTEENRPYVSIRPSDEIRNATDGITPLRSGDSLGAVVIDKVEDEASGKPGVIEGTKAFILTGWGLSTSFDGESVSVKSLVNGTEAIATVSRNENGQAVWASLGSALPAGKAKVCVTTRSGDSEGELWPVYKSVTIVAGTPPEPATVTLRTLKTEGMMDANVHYDTNPVTLEGENLTLGEGDRLYMKLYDDTDDRYVEIPSRFVKRNTSAAIDLGVDAGDDNIWNWIDQNCQPTEEHDRLTVKLISHGGVPSSDPQTVTATAVVQFA